MPHSPVTAHPFRVFHRGARSVAPENSLSGIQHAVAAGANWIEVDVRMTSDRELVLFHDLRLRRMLGLRGSLSRTTWNEIGRHGLLHGGVRTSERVPLALTAVRRITERATALVELKSNLDHDRATDFVRDVVRHCSPDRVVFCTRSRTLLRMLRATAPQSRIGLLLSPAMLGAAASPARSAADVIFVHWSICPRALVRRFHRANKLVVLTEVGFRDIGRRARAIGADGYFVTI